MFLLGTIAKHRDILSKPANLLIPERENQPTNQPLTTRDNTPSAS